MSIDDFNSLTYDQFDLILQKNQERQLEDMKFQRLMTMNIMMSSGMIKRAPRASEIVKLPGDELETDQLKYLTEWHRQSTK